MAVVRGRDDTRVRRRRRRLRGGDRIGATNSARAATDGGTVSGRAASNNGHGFPRRLSRDSLPGAGKTRKRERYRPTALPSDATSTPPPGRPRSAASHGGARRTGNASPGSREETVDVGRSVTILVRGVGGGGWSAPWRGVRLVPRRSGRRLVGVVEPRAQAAGQREKRRV